MIEKLKKLFGIGPGTDYAQLIKNGATILDVRSPGEFASGHIKNSLNIPVNNLQNNLSRIKKDKPIIACCASGMRSAAAKSLLEANGFKEVYNAGSWTKLRNLS